MNIVALKDKIKSRKATVSEIGQAVGKDPYLLFNFMMDNNLEDVNKTLKENLKNDNLPFVADRKKMEYVIDRYIQSGDNKSLQTIISEFDFNPNANNYTTNPAFLAAWQPTEVVYSGRFDAQGASELGTGIGAFLGPVFNSLGSSSTTSTTTDSKTGSMAVVITVAVIGVIAGAVYFLFFYSPKSA